MKTIPFLSILIVLALIAEGCKSEQGPTGADVQSTPRPVASAPAADTSNTQAPAGSNAAQNAAAAAEFIGVRINPGVRVTNTSGGKVFIFSDEGPPKPLLLHFTLDDRSDLTYFEDYILCATVHLQGMNEQGLIYSGLNYHISYKKCMEKEEYEGGIVPFMLEYEKPLLQHWIEGTASVSFSLPDRSQPRQRPSGPLVNSHHDGFRVSLVRPWSEEIVFHAVVVDPFDPEQETAWLEEAIRINEADLWSAARHTPLDIKGFRVGEPLYLSDEYMETVRAERGPNEIQSLALIYLADKYPGNRNYHVVVVSNQIARNPDRTYDVRFGGTAGTGKLSAITLTKVSRNPDSRPNTVLGIHNAVWHEIGHNLSLNHVYDGTGIGGPYENNYPEPDGHLYVDAYEYQTDGSVAVIEASEHFDFMAYTHPSWISAYSYRRMAERQYGLAPTFGAFRRVAQDDFFLLAECDFNHYEH